jgi:iron complex transport system substrate-binding protein
VSAVRIASLLPSATEIACALGLEGSLVGVSHECDHPPEVVRGLPRLTRSSLAPGLSASEIDAAVSGRMGGGGSLYAIDERLIESLRPDIIITQEVCPVCAVSLDEVEALACRLPGPPEVIPMRAGSLEGIHADVRAVAAAAGAASRGEAIVREMKDRVDRVRSLVRGLPRPRVAALEWLDPPFIAGHWVPEMVEAAGGDDVLGVAGGRSIRTAWEEVLAATPDVILVIPCGLSEAEAAAAIAGLEKPPGWWDLPAARDGRVFALDASGQFSRPGPRVVDGVESLARVLHGIPWRPRASKNGR